MVDRSLRGSLPALVALGLVWGAPSGTAAQRSGPPASSEAPLQGVVVDEATYQPVSSAIVKILGTDVEVSTNRWGSFAVPDVPPGQLSLQVSAAGHPSIVQDVEIREGRTMFVQIVLPSVAAFLSEILVQGTARGTSEGARTAADLLALQVPRTRVSSGVVGRSDYQIVLRASNTFQGSTAPLILIDGVVMSQDEGAFDALERIPASDVEGIDVLKGPAAAFLYPYAANGVVNVRTKKGSED
ncbi:MAG TPA: carboxypeptidase regulatory-like domain-containing protein [Longimicrobiales bacterium]|nr:carboxypeptidase regulatory-like domain-containing protein [Longimicrobiales bacterium]